MRHKHTTDKTHWICLRASTFVDFFKCFLDFFLVQRLREMLWIAIPFAYSLEMYSIKYFSFPKNWRSEKQRLSFWCTRYNPKNRSRPHVTFCVNIFACNATTRSKKYKENYSNSKSVCSWKRGDCLNGSENLLWMLDALYNNVSNKIYQKCIFQQTKTKSFKFSIINTVCVLYVLT